MTGGRTRFERWADAALIGAFAVGIALPLGRQIVAPVGDPTIMENRKAAELPVWKPHRETVIWFPYNFEKYYADHFGFRNVLISFHNYFTTRKLHDSPRRDVLMGKDGWLYFAG